MSEAAGVVVVGGGIVGASIAWRLTERGVPGVVLLERAELTSGSTWHAAGGFHSLNGAIGMAALQGTTIGLHDRLQAESEEPLGLRRTGAISLVVEQARALTAGVALRDLATAEPVAMAPDVDAGRAEDVVIADSLSGSTTRQEGLGLLYGACGQGPRHWSLRGTPAGSGMDLPPPDLDRMAPNLERAAEGIRCLVRAGIRRVVNGPPMVSPDGAVAGPVSPGLHVAAGVLAGFSQCGGIGLALARWIADGEPGMDAFAMDAARFGFARPGAMRARMRETYGRRYTLTAPNEHLSAARPLRVKRLDAAGAAWGAQSGWERPTRFAPPGTARERSSWSRSDAFPHVRAECLAVRDAVGFFETSPCAKVMVEGADVLPWLQAMTCALPARAMRAGPMPLVTPSGGLSGDLTVTRLDGDACLLIGSPQAEHLHARMLGDPPPGVHVANLTESWGGLSLSGPEAPAVLAALGIGLPPFGAAWIDVGAARVLALRLSFTGEAGAEVHALATLRTLHDAVLAAGRPHGLRPIGVSAATALRLEKLHPSFGSEIGADVDPFEAGLSRYVKAVHASAALIARGEGVRQRLCGLLADAGDSDPGGSGPVLAGGAVVGRVSSAAFGHRIGRAVALRPPCGPEGRRTRAWGPTAREAAA